MPRLCVKTNRPVSENEMIQTELYWCPRWAMLMTLASCLLLSYAYFVTRILCSITYGLDPSIRRRQALGTILKVCAAIGFLVATIVLAFIDSTHWIVNALWPISLILFVVAVVAIFVGNSPLSVVKHRNGMFWVKGFNKEYLALLPLEARAESR